MRNNYNNLLNVSHKKKLQSNVAVGLVQEMNESRSFVKHVSCDCRSRLYGKECNLKDGKVTIKRHV